MTSTIANGGIREFIAGGQSEHRAIWTLNNLENKISAKPDCQPIVQKPYDQHDARQRTHAMDPGRREKTLRAMTLFAMSLRSFGRGLHDDFPKHPVRHISTETMRRLNGKRS
jgi:hypothetical protein